MAEYMELTAANVQQVFNECRFDPKKQDDGTCQLVRIEGVRITVVFDESQIEKKQPDIESLLDQLPDEFQQNKGGGWTFLNAVIRKDGTQWADSHSTIDMLFCLGKAIDRVDFTFPRDMWPSLPGSMPYFMVKHSKESEAKP